MAEQTEWEEIQQEMNSGGGGFYSPTKEVPRGETRELTIVGRLKWTQTKYPIKTKDGKDLGYTWRFRLADGRVWDVSNSNRKVLLAGLHPDGTPTIRPGRFAVTNVGSVINKQPSVKVVYLGPATGVTPVAAVGAEDEVGFE